MLTKWKDSKSICYRCRENSYLPVKLSGSQALDESLQSRFVIPTLKCILHTLVMLIQ